MEYIPVDFSELSNTVTFKTGHLWLFKNTHPNTISIKTEKKQSSLPSPENWLNKHKTEYIKPLKMKAIFKMFPMDQ